MSMTKLGTLLNDSRSNRDPNSCGVVALALLLDKSYEEAYALLKSEGRMHGRGTNLSQFLNAITGSGGTFTRLDLNYVRQHAKTLRSLERTAEFSKGRYFIVTHRHGVAMIDGKIVDWTKDTLRRIITMYEIVQDKA